MRFRTFLLLCFIYAWFGRDGAHGQDCKINFTFTATGRIPALGFTNGTPSEPGCVTWTIVYYSTGFSALSLRLDSAPDSSGVAGAWVAFAATGVLAGSNPNTTTTQNFYSAYGYIPWISVNLTSVTGSGSIKGTAYGWKIPGLNFSTATIVPSGTQNVNLIQVGGAAIALGQAAMAGSVPVVIASNQTAVSENLTQIGGTNVPSLNGAAATLAGCPLSAVFALTASGSTRIITGSGVTTIYICSLDFTSDGVSNIRVVSGSGATCTSPTNITGLYSLVATYSNDFRGSLRAAGGADVCINQSGASVTGGTVFYAQF